MGMNRTRRNTTAALLAVFLTITLAGCTAPTVEQTSPGYDTGSDVSVEPSNPDMTTQTNGNEVTTDLAEQPDRDVVTTGTLSLIAENPADTSTQIRTITTEHEGRVETVTEQPGNDYQPGYAQLTLRVPADQFDETVLELKALGTVETFTTTTTDVTTQITEYQVREQTLRTSITRLQELLTEATDTDMILKVETTLSEREQELEWLLASQAYLEDQVQYSTLQVNVQQKSGTTNPTPDSFTDGVREGWEALTASVTGMLVMLGFLTPWLIVPAVLLTVGTAGWFLFRLLRKPATPSSDE